MIKVIAIDYDNTISLNPQVFSRWVPLLAKELDLEIIVATSRSGSQSDIEELTTAGVYDWAKDVVYCGWWRFKNGVCKKKGYDVIFWIDDEPEVDKHGGPIIATLNAIWKWFKKHI